MQVTNKYDFLLKKVLKKFGNSILDHLSLQPLRRNADIDRMNEEIRNSQPRTAEFSNRLAIYIES